MFLNVITLKEMCDEAVDTCPFVFDSFPDWYKTQEMCEKVVSKEAFMLNYCLDRYETKEMCNKVVDSCLPALKFIPDWFVKNKIFKRLDNVVFSNDDVDCDIDSNIAALFTNGMGLFTIDLNNNNNLDDNKFGHLA